MEEQNENARLSFNSTLVQLKAERRQISETGNTMFQFYLSSIKSSILIVNANSTAMFQFYLSSIKSVCRMRRLGKRTQVSILP